METRERFKTYLVYTMILGSFLMLRGYCYGAEKRTKVIDFEDEVVEGMNKRPLDSVSQISERDRSRRKPHLYRKRAGFRDETIQTLGEIR